MLVSNGSIVTTSEYHQGMKRRSLPVSGFIVVIPALLLAASADLRSGRPTLVVSRPVSCQR